MDICVCLKLSKNKSIIKSTQIEVTSASSVFVPFFLTQTWKDEYLYLFLAEEIIIRAAFKKKMNRKRGVYKAPTFFILS